MLTKSSCTAFANELASRLSGLPAARQAVLRAVADEDTSAICRLLACVGMDATAAAVTGFLDNPGPFLPSIVGWT